MRAAALGSLLIVSAVLHGQAPAGGRGGGMFAPLFNAFDKDRDGSIARPEIRSAFDEWYSNWDTAKSGALTQEQLLRGLNALLATSPADQGNGMNTFNAKGNFTPLAPSQPEVDAMIAALPATPGAKPARPRKVLVFAHTGAGGFVHASIPLSAKMVEALGAKGGLWTTAVSYDPKDINAANLKQYDAIFLDSNTACFLDDEDQTVTAARRAAFLDFVRSGKGVAAVHAATDSYHTDCRAAFTAARSGVGGGIAGFIANAMAGQFMELGDADHDRSLTRAEFTSVADIWFDKLDKEKSGKVGRADFDTRLPGLLLSAAGRGRAGGRAGGETQAVLQWPEFNKLIGGYFKFHWLDPQLITVKIDDPNSPLTAMFHGREFDIHDETYTFAEDSFSRANAHVLTSIDYGRMSQEDKDKEVNPRTDGDYALSYIRREGKGRVFYEAHGHSPVVYTMTPMLEHFRAGIQYALGDLKADDSPSRK